MNFRLISLILGRILLIAAAAMAPSLLVSLLYGDGAHMSFIVSMVSMATIGAVLVLFLKKHRRSMQPMEGFVAVALCWIAITLFGALPSFISGIVPNYVDALFESAAGFTTTGATVLTSIEGVPESLVFWRAFSQWLGGMGVLMLTLAILPAGERGVYNLMRAESTGPSSERLVPRIRRSAMILYAIYLSLTLLQTVMLLFGGMSLFDALIHTFSTAGTGGFSSRNLNIGSYNSGYIEYTVAAFMLLFSVNFGLYYALIVRRLGRIVKNTEIKVFLCIIVVSTVLIGADLLRAGVYESFSETARHSFFHTASIGSSTAFFTVDYTLWPGLSRTILFCLMIIGGCAGSTASGIKAVRVAILYKSAAREVKKIIHPRSVSVVHMNGEPLQDKALAGVLHFFVVYVMVIIAATLVVSLDNKGFETTFSGVVAMISNVGVGFGSVGPAGNYTDFSILSKAVMSLTMLIGRLEIFPILMLIIPSAWKRA